VQVATFGRGADADIKLQHASLSRIHAHITAGLKGELQLVDLGSSAPVPTGGGCECSLPSALARLMQSVHTGASACSWVRRALCCHSRDGWLCAPFFLIAGCQHFRLIQHLSTSLCPHTSGTCCESMHAVQLVWQASVRSADHGTKVCVHCSSWNQCGRSVGQAQRSQDTPNWHQVPVCCQHKNVLRERYRREQVTLCQQEVPGSFAGAESARRWPRTAPEGEHLT
jgi:hypothetical protein